MFAMRVLDNGVRVVLDSSLGVRSVTVCVAVGAGSRHDGPAEAGLAHLVEHLVTAAPRATFGGASISKWVDSVGGQSNASTSHEAVTFWARVPPAAARDCARGLCAAIVEPVVDDALCAAERQVVVQELLAAAGDPFDVAQEAFYGKLFAGHPLSRPIGGGVDFPAFTAERVLDAHRRSLRAVPLVVCLVGPAELLTEAFDAVRESGIGDLDRADSRRPGSDPGVSGGAPTAVVEPDATYAYLVAGGVGAGRDDPLWGAAEVLTAAVGGTPGSVLYDRLRGELGVGYQLRSDHTSFSDTGAWTVTAGAQPEHAGLVASTIRDCLVAVASGRLGDDGFAAARTQAAGSVLLDNEDPVALAHLNCTWGARAGEPPVAHVQRLIGGVEHHDVRAIASRVLESYTHVVAS